MKQLQISILTWMDIKSIIRIKEAGSRSIRKGTSDSMYLLVEYVKQNCIIKDTSIYVENYFKQEA